MQLIKPNKEYFNSYVEAIEENRINGVSTYDFLDVDSYDIFEHIDNCEKGINLPVGWVPATYFWMVEGNEFLGEVCIRHELTADLLRFGGNIGYGVRYSKWNKGIGTEMLRQALQYAKEYLHLDKVLITCIDDNYGSYHVIENNGGVLQDKIENIINGKKRISRRYWILIK